MALPLVTGIVLSVGGYESLKSRAESDRQLNRIESNTERALGELPNISQTIETISRYERSLSEAGQRDETLSAVLTQYKKMVRATQMWEERRGVQDLEEKYRLASEVLDIISSNLATVVIRDDLRTHPLIIGLGDNTFRVLFAVPMRIPPQLVFEGIPTESQPNILAKSKYGFTVNFQPSNLPVTTFSFSADAEL